MSLISRCPYFRVSWDSTVYSATARWYNYYNYIGIMLQVVVFLIAVLLLLLVIILIIDPLEFTGIHSVEVCRKYNLQTHEEGSINVMINDCPC